MNIPRAALVLSGLVSFARAVEADPCRTAAGMLRAPIAITTDEAAFATSSSPCASTTVGLAARGSALIATADYYGALLGEAVLSGSYAFDPRLWISAEFTPFQFHFAQDATFVATQAGLGPSTAAVHYVPWRSERWQLAMYLRALIPTTTGAQYVSLVGVEPGVSVVFAPHDRWAFFASASMPLSFALIDGAGERAHVALDPRFALDASWHPVPAFEALVGAALRLATDDAGPVASFAPQLALRAHFSPSVRLELAAMVPVAGTDRTLARGSLGVLVLF